ncbi:MAG: SseB family protein [Variovorax sp.]|nr:SseB family protein [Variovorax sp.]
MDLLNQLELVLAHARTGSLTMDDLLKELADSDLVVPSRTAPVAGGTPFRPLLLVKDQGTLMACFTDRSRVGDFTSVAPHLVVMTGRDVLSALPAGMGLVINPGTSLNLEIFPDGTVPAHSRL